MSDDQLNNQALQPYNSAPARKVRPEKYLTAMRQKWWIVLITVLLAVGASVAYIKFRATQYVSSASMWVGGKMRIGDAGQYSEELTTFYGTQIELITSGKIAERAYNRILALNTNLTAPRDEFGRLILPKIRVSQAPKSAVFGLSSTSTNAEYAQVYLNAVMNEFLLYKKEARTTTSSSALGSVSAQMYKAENDLKQEQLALTEFQQRTNNNIALLQEQASGGGNQLAQLNAQLASHELEMQLMDAVAMEQSIGGSAKTNSLDASSLNKSNQIDSASMNRLVSSSQRNDATPASLVNAKQQLQVLKIQREQLARYLRPKHPKMTKLDEEIVRGEHVLEFYKKQNESEIKVAKQALALRIESVKAAIVELKKSVAEATLKLSEYERIRNNIARQQSLYDSLRTLLQSVDINSNIDQENVSILEPASAAINIEKSPVVIVAIAVFLGALAGIGLLFIIAYRDDRCNSLEEMRDCFNEEIVGQIPDVTSRKKGVVPWFRLDSDNHIFIESCKNLRSSLIYRAADGEKPKTILIVSAAPDEGKSTVAANLARTLAYGGANVLLVDADLRRGTQHHLFGLPAGPGLTDLLSSAMSGDRINSTSPLPFLQATEIPTLQFLARGKDDFDASELFLKPAFDSFLQEARRRFDYVIIDSCPIFAADDATTVAPKMDGVLFVFRRGHTQSSLAQMALELLYQRQAKIMGIVFNRADSQANSYRYYKYSKYYRQAKTV